MKSIYSEITNSKELNQTNQIPINYILIPDELIQLYSHMYYFEKLH